MNGATQTILVGDALSVLRTMPDQSVQAIVTSPPYYGLRDYQTDPVVFGGDPCCDHDWNEQTWYREGGGQAGASGERFVEPGPENAARLKAARWRQDATCAVCGAWRGNFGAEPTLAMYIAHAVEIFHEARRVLRNDGTFWLVIGDSYASGKSGSSDSTKVGFNERYHGKQFATDKQADGRGHVQRHRSTELPEKNLMGVPWRLAIALQDDGWILRNDHIWWKQNGMPESVTDRATRDHEYVFQFSKRQRYYWDYAGGLQPSTRQDTNRFGKRHVADPSLNEGDPNYRAGHERWGRVHTTGDTRNVRTVWPIPTMPFAEAHFAVYPPELVRTILRVATPVEGCCAVCARPWVRQIEKTGNGQRIAERPDRSLPGHLMPDAARGGMVTVRTIGWNQACACVEPGPPVPSVVLDPFGGSGTTLLTANNMSRSGIAIELNPEYADVAKRRILKSAPMFVTLTVEDRRGEQGYGPVRREHDGDAVEIASGNRPDTEP